MKVTILDDYLEVRPERRADVDDAAAASGPHGDRDELGHDEGANEIDVVASDDQGNHIDTSLFITRGE